MSGSTFTGKPIKETKCGAFNAVVAEISGHAYYTGEASFVVEENDPFKEGLLVRS